MSSEDYEDETWGPREERYAALLVAVLEGGLR